MNKLQIIKGIECFSDENGMIQLKLENVARGLGFTQIKNDVEYIRTDRVTSYLTSFGFSPQLGKEEFIPEPIFYMLAMKAESEQAKKFQKIVAYEILPSIRKHGLYAIDDLLDNPDLLIKAATQLKEERAARLEAEKQKDKLIHQGKLYTTGELAKELNLSSATKLNNLLAEKKIQFKQNGTWLLYSKYSEMNLISIKQQQLDNGKIIYDRHWSGLGRDFILNLFINRGEINGRSF